jgi:ribosome biogenesis protein MAK21
MNGSDGEDSDLDVDQDDLVEDSISDAESDGSAWDYSETGPSVTDADDADDLVDPAAKALVDPTKSDGADSDAEQTCFSHDKKRKRNDSRKEDARAQRKKLRSLPAFANYEDYAHLIEDEPEENW